MIEMVSIEMSVLCWRTAGRRMNVVKGKKIGLLDILSPQDALEILKVLHAQDVKIADRIECLAHEFLKVVDIEAIAEEVYAQLDALDVEELWGRSGPNYEGYHEPGEMAYEMLQEVLEPFLNDLKKCRELSLSKCAMLHCMGILKGIGRYDSQTKSQFKEWVPDDVWECGRDVLEEWEKGTPSTQDRQEIKEFIKTNFPDKGIHFSP